MNLNLLADQILAKIEEIMQEEHETDDEDGESDETPLFCEVL